MLDVVYREDQSRIREENSALNMAWLRKTTLGLLKRASHIKGCIRRKQLAIWANPNYLNII
jgi:predicted transposase YbfD/YdcC